MSKKILLRDPEFPLQADLDERMLSLVEEYYANVRETEKYWLKDNTCALKIQSIFRMYKKMQYFLKCK
jgi:hypothetical protein